MAFTSAIVQRPIAFGNRRMSWGTFTNSGGGTGGNVDTGLRIAEVFTMTSYASAVGNDPVLNEDLPVDGSALTIVTDADEVGTWFAIGY